MNTSLRTNVYLITGKANGLKRRTQKLLPRKNAVSASEARDASMRTTTSLTTSSSSLGRIEHKLRRVLTKAAPAECSMERI